MLSINNQSINSQSINSQSLNNQYTNFKLCINSFDYIKYFEQEFNRIINCIIDEFDINYLFRCLYYVFNIDFYILLLNLDKKYYNLNELSINSIKELINLFTNHYIRFYKKNIEELLKLNLINNEKYYVNDIRRNVKYINLNKYTNEYIINKLKNKSNLIKCIEITKIFEHIRYPITTSFIKYKKYCYIEDIKNKFDIYGTSKSMFLSEYVIEKTSYRYNKYLDTKFIKSDYSDELYYNLFWHDKIKNFKEKYLNEIPKTDIFYNIISI